MGITRREVDPEDAPRRTGLGLRPSLNLELTALASLDNRRTTDLLNEAVREYVDRRKQRGGASDRRRKRAELSA